MFAVVARQLTSIGAPVFLALLAVSVVGTAVAVQKIVMLWRLGAGNRYQANAALRQWAAGDAEGAHRIAWRDHSPLGRVILQAIAGRWQWPQDKERAREAATGVALGLLEEMGSNVRILDTAVQAAPMLGLLGTVLGMIVSFNEMSVGSGAVDPAQLAGGIWIALSTTALGLTIAIPFYFLTSWIDGRIDRERTAMDAAIIAIIFGHGPEFQGAEAAQTRSPPPKAGIEGVGFSATRPRW